MKKLLIGGSPCVKWSIIQKNREIIPSGEGWELFDNYLIAKQKFKPDFFLYENKRLNNQRINMIPNAAIAILPMHPAAMHPPAIAPPTASSDFPELA